MDMLLDIYLIISLGVFIYLNLQNNLSCLCLKIHCVVLILTLRFWKPTYNALRFIQLSQCLLTPNRKNIVSYLLMFIVSNYIHIYCLHSICLNSIIPLLEWAKSMNEDNVLIQRAWMLRLVLNISTGNQNEWLQIFSSQPHTAGK